jgi:hypothetical protein
VGTNGGGGEFANGGGGDELVDDVRVDEVPYPEALLKVVTGVRRFSSSSLHALM